MIVDRVLRLLHGAFFRDAHGQFEDGVTNGSGDG